MANNRTLRGNVTIWIAFPEAFADMSAPTTTEMAVSALVQNVSCAVEDSYTANQTDATTDDSQSVCDTSSVSTPTASNYEVSLDFFADQNPTAVGYYNTARNLTRVKGRNLVVVKRLNKAQGAAVAVGDILSTFLVKTDNPVLMLDRNAAVKFGARFKPQGAAYSDIRVAA